MNPSAGLGSRSIRTRFPWKGAHPFPISPMPRSFTRRTGPQTTPARPLSVSDRARLSPPPSPLPRETRSPASWAVEDLDREFRSFTDDARYLDGQSIETVRSYNVAYQNFRRFLLATAGPGASVETALFAIEAWVRWNREAGRQGHTLNSYWRKLRSFHQWLDRRHGIPSPFVGLRAPTPPTRLPKARTPDECRRILDAAEQIPWLDPHDRALATALVATVLYAGLRRKELLCLKFLDADLTARMIRVNGGKGRGGGKDRIVPMAPELHRILEAYSRRRSVLRIEAPEFFCSRHSKRGISLSTLRRIIRRTVLASGIPFSLHSLRHSFVTQLLRSGVALHTAGALAGHSQITTTAGYLRVFDEDKEDAVRDLKY